MRRLLWILAWFGVVVWSLFAWGAYGLIDLFGNVAARNADIVTDHPETVEWLSWTLTILQGLGLAAIVVVWGLVSLLILAVPAVLSFFLRRAEPGHPHPAWPQVQRPGRVPPAPHNGRSVERR
jgi:hypothetical protein